MKGEIVRSIECNSTISSFFRRWQNLNWISKTHGIIHKITIEIEKKICIPYKNTCTWITMVQEKIQKILVFSPFLSIEPERKEEKELEIRMFTSFSAEKIRTRGVMAFKMNNPWRNKVVLCRREVANTFKKCKELNKSKHIWMWKSGAKNVEEFWKNFRVLKSFYQ